MLDLSTKASSLLPIVGLTGGIGSGKSTVAKIFASLGVPVYHADEAAKELYIQDQSLKQWIIDAFGEGVGNFADGALVGINREKLAQIVFNDEDLLQKLNQEVHPRVKSAFHRWLEIQSRNPISPYVIREAAILFESRTDQDCDYIIAVEAPVQLRIQRASDHLKITPEAVESRIKNQWTDAERANKADHIISNSTHDPLLEQTLKIHHQILETLA